MRTINIGTHLRCQILLHHLTNPFYKELGKTSRVLYQTLTHRPSYRSATCQADAGDIRRFAIWKHEHKWASKCQLRIEYVGGRVRYAGVGCAEVGYAGVCMQDLEAQMDGFH